MEENERFGWSSLYRTTLLIFLLIPFADIFIQLALGNWVWLAVSAIFFVIILGMLLFSFKRPFVELAQGELRFYLFPMPPIVFQRIKLGDIVGFAVDKSRLVIDLANGKTARVNLYVVKVEDRERLLEYFIGTNHQLS